MLVKGLLLFTIVPLLEVWVLVRIGQVIGPLPTVLLVGITGFVGVFLAKSQGLFVIRKLQAKLSVGEIPTDELFGGAAILVGGALLLTPGVITDLLGFSLLLPLTRKFWQSLTMKVIRKMMQQGTVNVYYSGDFRGFYDVTPDQDKTQQSEWIEEDQDDQ